MIFSLKIEEDWRTEDSNDARDIQQAHQEQSPLREIIRQAVGTMD